MKHHAVSFSAVGQTDPAIFAGLSWHRAGEHSEGRYRQWELGLTIEGRCRWGYPGGELEMRPGLMIIVRPHTAMEWRVPPGERWGVISVVFHPRPHWLAWLDEHDYHGGVAAISLEGKDLAAAGQKVLAVERLYQRRALHRDEWALASLERVLLALRAQMAHEKMGLDKRLRAAQQVMHLRFSHSLTVGDIAVAAHISPSHLSALFQQQLDTTPMQYLERVRLERAEGMLRFTSLAITEIALGVGFNDPNYFARRFRAYSGQTPRAFRQAARAESMQAQDEG